MPDLNAIPGMTALRSQTKGDPRIKIAVLDGPIDLDRACFQSANITRLDPYWSEEFPIDPQHLQAFLDVEKSGKSDEEKGDMLKEAIPDENILHSLHLRFHANHIISTICGQPDSPVEGIAPNATVINIPIAYSNDDFINPLNLSRAISTAIEQGVNIIHCAACHPTQSGLAHEFIDKAIRQAQANNILVIAPGGNDKGECWCVPAVLENVLTVGAMKDTGEPFKFSNFGGKYATQGILAPGENILGAQPATDDPIRKKGTSCAAPIVTGTAALLMSLQLEQGLSPDAEAVRAALINSAIPCDPKEVEEPERCLLGKINIAGAYELLTGEPLKEVEKQGKEETAEKEAGEQLPVTLVSPQSPVITAISNLNNLENGMIPSNVTENSTSVTISEKQQISNTIVPSNITPSQRSNLVYVLGTLGYDFGTEARRDTFKQLMPSITIDNLELPSNPYDARQMVDYLESNLSETKSLIWTVNLELTPIYAIKPVGAFAAEIYQVMQYMLAGQILPEADEDYVERVSIPGLLTEETVRLFSGQIVPVIKVNSPRGMYGWKVNTLIESAIETVRTEHEIADEARMRRSLTSFLNRIYYDLRNVGQIARDRALNFAATNAFQAVQTFSQAVAMGMELHSIEVEKSPFCRYGSECWDVKLKFFDPENGLRAKRVFRFTIDVSDRTPVTLGEVRSWAVSK
ncbi:MAG: PatA/PatG family cyanobactin maturation protease [Microcystis sp. M54BS1]|uniref:S8 family peptidase n=1 Tax=unclassified Microcystis TaxID=2643300 RepID=UPI00258000C3|nr:MULTISPECIES: PatA/PatG family cyanobactin maturation protease [unclassified Microcystis]MCA2540525.1 PatA/PatG family cyanobactin maturation protease [Microcystis sp. M54BS1]MCA2595012.1 PatA/PatG family cyanobactin maturation protease [Microcystis sp. M38BS1]MCA2610892.1 PatA/PatG family cyanobactin maturation protease [Microcystis sp. M27BS1]MCA2504258.1 PatA/PatG family cyanobactin maturation protease [Microcystis sp. M62BS1]MCA2510485.1 PatA/PatG family cyanobactin maturation protease 